MNLETQELNCDFAFNDSHNENKIFCIETFEVTTLIDKKKYVNVLIFLKT